MRIRVLVIDKFPLVREGMASALASDPAIEIVGKAADGTEGLQLARDTTPDVVLLDLDLRDIDGMLVLEGLRQQVPDARVLIVTASENPEGLVAAVGAGAAGYLTKPAGQAELRDAVITVHGGGTVIAPSLAGHLVQRYARASQGDTDALRTALTPRENEVLRLVAQGLTDRQIGEAIFAAPSTVQNHLARIREKTGARSRRALARLFRCFDDADAGCSHKPGS